MLQRRRNRSTLTVWATLAGVLLAVSAGGAADLYWDTDPTGPLQGNGSTLNFGGNYFSTSPSGNTALTTIGSGNDIYFQTDTVKAYTCNVDTAQTIASLTVANSNDVTIQTSVDGNTITCSGAVSVVGGSSLKLKQISNALILDGAPRTDITLGSGNNTLTIEGSAGSSAFWIGNITGDAGDRIIFDAGSMWIRSSGTSVFGGELIGSPRLSPGTLTLTVDNPDLAGTLEGGTVILGDGGTIGTIGSAKKTQAGSLRINRSDDYVLTNTIATAAGNQSITLANDGTGSITLLTDVTVGNLFFSGYNTTLRGDVSVTARLWFNAGAGIWTFAGTNNSAGGSIYNAGLRTASGSAMRIGDGTSYAKMTANWNCQMVDNSDLIMDLTGGAQLAVNSNLVVGTGCNLVIIGGGQEDPIITCVNSVSPFDNVVYNGKTNTWAEAQVTGSLRMLGARTQMRVEGQEIYIDPLPPGGTVLIIL